MIILCDSRDLNIRSLKHFEKTLVLCKKMYKSHLKVNHHKKAHIRNY